MTLPEYLINPTIVECPTCHAWVGWACNGRDYGYHAAGYHPSRYAAAAARSGIRETVLRARWAGPPPRAGEYLMAPSRARHAYRVLRVHVIGSRVTWDAENKVEVRRLLLGVERIEPGKVPKAAKVHAWHWDKRERKRR